jgi:hypothetical protein
VVSKIQPELGGQSWQRKVFLGRFSEVFDITRPNRWDFCNSEYIAKDSHRQDTLVVETDFGKNENSQSCEQNFLTCYQLFHFFPYNYT